MCAASLRPRFYNLTDFVVVDLGVELEVELIKIFFFFGDLFFAFSFEV